MTSDTIRVKVEKIIRELVSASQTRSMYGKSHNLTREAVERLYSKLADALSDTPEITIGIIGNEIAFEKEPFYEISKNIEGFISYLSQIKIEKISFSRGVDQKELSALLDILVMNTQAVEKSGGAGKILGSSGIRHIFFGHIGFSKREEDGEDEEDAGKIAQANFQDGIDFLTKTVDDIASNRPIDASAARFFVSKIIGNLLKNKYSLLILTSIKNHDEYTFEHSINVAIFTIAQAEALGLRDETLADIGVAALLHDTGKLALSGDIIRKKGRLDREEIGKIRMHPLDGAKMLIETPGLNPLAAITSFEHHIQYDMKGYPQKLYGDKLNLASMMIAVADVYDALRSKRAYHQDMAPEKTYDEMMRLSGEHFSPQLLDNFFHVIGVYSPGTLVELDNRSIGLVVKESALDIRRPQVEILYNSKGEKERNPYIINLLEKDPGTDNYKWSIVKSLAITDKYEIPGKYS